MTFPIEPAQAVFSHQPIRPVRGDVIGEVVMMEHWHELMRRNPGADGFDDEEPMLDLILRSLPGRLNERRATVAASIIRWLGTNNGRAYLQEAERQLQQSAGKYRLMDDPSMIWLSCWAVENRRDVWSSNLRTLEAIMAPESHFKGQEIIPAKLDVEDYEVAEHLMIWFGTTEGAAFLSRAQDEIQKRLAAAREQARIEALERFRLQA